MRVLFASFCGAALLLVSGCATNKYPKAGHEDQRRGRVDGQWADEAGLRPTPAHYQHVKQAEHGYEQGGGAGQTGYVTPLPSEPIPLPPTIPLPPDHPGGGGQVVSTGDIEFQICQEELVVGKRTVSNGAVLIRKLVKSEPASATISLNREEYVIERVPGGTRTGADCFTEKTVVLCLTKEEPVVGTRVVPGATEIVRIRKQVHTDERKVTGTIRKESFEVVKLADCPTNTVTVPSGNP